MSWDVRNFVVDVAAGSCGGAGQIIVGHPFDTIKVKLQMSASASDHGAVSIFRKVVKTEGMPGLFRGIGPPLATVSLLNAVLFSANGYLRGMARKISNLPENAPLTTSMYAACGAGSGVFMALVACPTELVKCRLQIQSQGHVAYQGPMDCTRSIIRNRGILGMYTGLTPTLLREVPGGLAYFTCYEVLKKSLTDVGKAPSQSTMLLSGGVAGVVYWGSTYPFDIIKTKIQTDSDVAPRYRSTADCAAAIYRESGLRGFFRGVSPALIRAFPANAACFFIYETVSGYLSKSFPAQARVA
mmetsp:Transcript_21908/g.89106  ORF Transcript_21908/g.89106 Transcript_21908/m.89106 type:complete len:299 (-) Transcript_21908:880-1776(-)